MNVTDFQVSEETLKYLEREFRKRDKDRSGTIDCSELEECLQLCGILPTREDIVFLQKHFDTSGDKELEIGELLENIDVINAHSLQGNRLMNTFRRLDPRGTGVIRNKALKDFLKDHMRWDEAEKYISHLARTYDTNKDGKFNYPEFVRMMVCEADPLKDKLEKKNRCK